MGFLQFPLWLNPYLPGREIYSQPSTTIVPVGITRTVCATPRLSLKSSRRTHADNKQMQPTNIIAIANFFIDYLLFCVPRRSDGADLSAVIFNHYKSPLSPLQAFFYYLLVYLIKKAPQAGGCSRGCRMTAQRPEIVGYFLTTTLVVGVVALTVNVPPDLL